MKYTSPSSRLTMGADNIKNQNNQIPDHKKENGKIMHKYPVRLSDGKTTIYIKDKSKENETRARWEAIINKNNING